MMPAMTRKTVCEAWAKSKRTKSGMADTVERPPWDWAIRAAMQAAIAGLPQPQIDDYWKPNTDRPTAATIIAVRIRFRDRPSVAVAGAMTTP